MADELDAYLVRHVLAPRYPAAVDRERGGFHAHFAPDWTRQPDRRRFVVYQARMTWTSAAVALARAALREEHLG
jgi:mannobiose 2-epimerase